MISAAFLRRRCPKLAKLLKVMDELAPFKLADTTWDNVGLIYESPRPSADAQLKVMLAIDLTESIIDQAKTERCSVILAYHPPWFGGAKRLVQERGSEARLVALCADAGISLVAPHTALDNSRPGMNDYGLKVLFPGETDIRPITPSALPGFEDCGAGRIVRLQNPLSLKEIMDRVSSYVKSSACMVDVKRMSSNNHLVRFASASKDLEARTIRNIGICVGSGASLLKAHYARLMQDEAVEPLDCFLTGEMSHHDILKAVNEFCCPVVMTEHTRLERAYLYSEYQKRLAEALGPDAQILVPKDDVDPVCYYANSQAIYPAL